MEKEEIDRQLSVIRNDFALGRFDDRELDILASLLEMFNDYITIHRKEIEEGYEGCLG